MPGAFDVQIVQAPPASVVASGYFMTSERLENMLDPMYEGVGHMANQIRENFASESSDGIPWEPWSIFYRQKRSEKGEYFLDPVTGERTYISAAELVASGARVAGAPQKILQLTGDLHEAATDTSSWEVEQSGRDVTAILTDVPSYGIFHVAGAPEVHLPQRDWSFIADETLDKIDEEFMNYILDEN